MKIFFASSHELSAPIAQALIDENFVSGFITNTDKPVGRKKELTPNSFAKWADDTNIPVYKPNTSAELDKLLEEESVELVITCAYGSLIKKRSLEIPIHGWLNVHFSLLPKYRGAAPAQRALINGDTSIGYSIFKLDEGLDTGPILFKEEVPVSEEVGATKLLLQLANLAAVSICKLLEDPKKWNFTLQSGESSLAPKISNEEKRIDWNSGAQTIRNLERAMEINGGIHTYFRGEKLAIRDLSISDKKVSAGELVFENGDLRVGTADNAIIVKNIQPAGKKWMLVSDWLNGARLKPGEKFE